MIVAEPHIRFTPVICKTKLMLKHTVGRTQTYSHTRICCNHQHGPTFVAVSHVI